MGQYFHFINRTRQEVSQISLPFNFGLSYAKSLERYSYDERQAMFQFVIHHNEGWLVEDEVVAEGDYGAVLEYEASIRDQQESYSWEAYVPEKIPTQTLAVEAEQNS